MAKDIDSASGYPNKSIFYSYFESWNKALIAAGFTPKFKRYTDEELEKYFMKFVELHGRPPKYKEFNSNPSYPSFWCYQNRFGSWNKALIAYGYKASVGSSGSHHVFENGELCKSYYEYDISTWLRSNKISYLRNVPFNEWVSSYSGRKDCDYVIMYNGETIWLEVAGLYPSNCSPSPMELDYKTRFDHKVDELLCNFNYKVFYPQDFKECAIENLFEFLKLIPRPTWMTYQDVFAGVGEPYEVLFNDKCESVV